MSIETTPRGRAARPTATRAASPYIELELDIDFEDPAPAPASAQPVTAPEPTTAEPQSVKAAIIRWLESRC